MKIYFTPRDNTYYGIKEIIEPIVDIAITNASFMKIVCSLLTVIDTYDNSDNKFNDKIRKCLLLYRKLYIEYESDKDDLLIKFQPLEDAIINFYYAIIEDYDFENNIRAYDEKNYYKEHLYDAKKRLSRYRGLLFEKLVESLTKKRFDSGLFETGCRIYINNSHLIFHYGTGDASHKETIDIAGWIDDIKYGEFYECKINPDRLAREHYKFLALIIDVLKDNKISNCIVAFVSADSEANMVSRKKYIESLYDDCNSDFALIGLEDIYKINSYSVPEIA